MTGSQAPAAPQPAPASAPITAWGVLVHWARTNVGLAITVAGLIASALAFLSVVVIVMVRGEFGHMWINLIAVAYTLTWLMLATTVVRTIGPRDLFRALFSGFFLTMGLTLLLVVPVKGVFGNNDFTVAFVVPVVEELTKAVAIVLILWSMQRRHARSIGLTDATVVGLAVGCGFFLHEDTLYPRSVTAHLDGSIGAMFAHPWGVLFPTHFNFGAISTVAHPGWGLIIGFGIGLAVLMLRTRLVLGIGLAAGCYVFAVFGHGSWNASGMPEYITHGAAVLQQIAMPLMIATAIVVDALRRRLRPADLPRPHPRFYLRAQQLAEGPWRLIERLVALTRYRREWNSVAYARARDASLPALEDDPGLISWFLLGVGPSRSAAGQASPDEVGDSQRASAGDDPADETAARTGSD